MQSDPQNKSEATPEKFNWWIFFGIVLLSAIVAVAILYWVSRY